MLLCWLFVGNFQPAGQMSWVTSVLVWLQTWPAEAAQKLYQAPSWLALRPDADMSELVGVCDLASVYVVPDVRSFTLILKAEPEKLESVLEIIPSVF